MSVTVGIATTGEHPATLRRAVRHAAVSARRAGQDAEVLVVVNGPAPSPAPSLDPFDGVAPQMLRLVERNVAAARNLIVERARHDTILFTDDDCLASPDWCRQMHAALRRPDHPVVTAPVRMETVAGPVTAFFDHLRLFDPAPQSADNPPALVTAACGLRRDLIPASIRFDPSLRSAGEDTHFALALAAAGIPVRHLDTVDPIRHGLSEHVEELTERFLRNARSGPHLFLRSGFALAAMPEALSFYPMWLDDGFRFHRRYAEIVDPAVRAAFAVYDAILVGVTLVGYLDAIGAELDCRLVDLDEDGLAAAWGRIEDLVAARVAGVPAQRWARVEVDCRRAGALDCAPEPLVAEVKNVLREYAPPCQAQPSAQVADVLSYRAAPRTEAFTRYQDQVRQAWAVLRESDEPVSGDAADRVARSLGFSMRMAGDIAELVVAFDASRARRHAGARS